MVKTGGYPSKQKVLSNPQLSGRDIVIVGLQPWYFKTGCNCKNIAIELAKTNRVLYVNFAIKRKAYLEKQPDPKIEQHVSIIRNKEPKIRNISDNLWEYYPSALVESVNWIPSKAAFKAVNYLNNRRFAKDIQEGLAALNFKKIVLFNDNDVYNGFFLKELLNPDLYIYYIRDFLSGYAYWKKHVSVLEPQLMKKSDLVVANSTSLNEYGLKHNSNSFYIGQGCSLDHFDHKGSFARPDDIPAGAGPVIGYIGALDSDRLDIGILEAIANHNKDWKIVLVGPEDQRFESSSLHQYKNVYFPGRKPFEQLAAYVNSFDVCINPQLKNDITKGNYPLKIDEYLAMGKPVIATDTGAMKMFKDFTYLGNTPAQYPSLIEQALAEDSPTKRDERIAFANSHTWENCISELSKAVTKIVNNR